MKTIENKETEIDADGKGTMATYGDIIKGVLETVPLGQGVTISDMRMAINVVGAIDSSNGKIKLEDAEFDYMKKKLNENQWGIVHKDIVEMVEYIESI